MHLARGAATPTVHPQNSSSEQNNVLFSGTFTSNSGSVTLPCFGAKDLTYRDVTAMVTSFSPLGPTEAPGLPVGPGRGVFNQLTRAWTGRLRGVARGPGAKAWPRSRPFLELRFFIPERDGDRVWPRNRGLVTGTS